MSGPANQLVDGLAIVHPTQTVAYQSLKRLVEQEDGSLTDVKLSHSIYHWTNRHGQVHMATWRKS